MYPVVYVWSFLTPACVYYTVFCDCIFGVPYSIRSRVFYLDTGASFSSLAFSTLAFLTVPRFPLSHFQFLNLGDGDTDRCEILHDGTYRSRHFLLPFGGGTPRDRQNSKF